MRGLYDKFSRHPDTKNALVHELEGRYTQAMAFYNQLLSGGDETSTEEGFGDLEMDLWEDGLEECMKRAHKWSELEKWYITKVTGKQDTDDAETFEHDIWKDDNRRLLGLHFSQLIGSCSIASIKGSQADFGMQRKKFSGMVEEIWFRKDEGSEEDRTSYKSKGLVLQQEFEHETALALLISDKPARVHAKDLINGALSRFLADWSSSNETGQVARLSLTLSLSAPPPLPLSL